MNNLACSGEKEKTRKICTYNYKEFKITDISSR